MSVLTTTARRIGEAKKLDATAELVQSFARTLTESPTLDSVLGGDWLGHPVHPMATDVPIGAWTMATILDLAGDKRFAGAVDLLTLVGLVSALPTAVTGVHDWATTTGEARRVGLVHALAMDAALAMFAAALVARRRGKRTAGRTWALAGWGVAGAGGFLGGHLTYALGVGVEPGASAS